MNLIATMPIRNEGCYIGLTLRAALTWCDQVIVLLHVCTDDSQDIVFDVAEESGGRVKVLIDHDSTWREMMHRQRLLDAARQEKATHVAIVDADEILTGPSLADIRDYIGTLKPGCFWGINMHNLHRSIHRYRSDPGIWGHKAGTLIAFRDRPDLRWHGDRFHSRHPDGSRMGGILPYSIAVMHLQFASWRRLTAKHALYKITERLRWPQKPTAEIDALYNQALNEEGCETTEVPAEWWEPYRDLLPLLRIDQEPWQEAECARLVEKHGIQKFEGLNLFGVVPQEVLQ